MRSYLLYFFLLVVMSFLFLIEPLSSEWLRYDRDLIASGEVWRLFTAHFVHLSAPHLLGNSLGIIVLGYMAGNSLSIKLGIGLLIWCCAVVGVGLYVFADYLKGYVGFSGVLHGLLLVAPFVSNSYSNRIARLILLVIVGKVIWEQTPFYNDMAMFDVIGGRVETKAHALGVFAGLTFLIVYKSLSYYRSRWRTI